MALQASAGGVSTGDWRDLNTMLWERAESRQQERSREVTEVRQGRAVRCPDAGPAGQAGLHSGAGAKRASQGSCTHRGSLLSLGVQAGPGWAVRRPPSTLSGGSGGGGSYPPL